MPWSQLFLWASLWLIGLPLLFFGILGIMLGVAFAASTEYTDAVGVVFIVLGAIFTLHGAGLWFFAGWLLYRGNKKK